MNINYPDYPLLDKFFGGEDLLIFSLCNLFLAAIAWPIIAFNLPPPTMKEEGVLEELV